MASVAAAQAQASIAGSLIAGVAENAVKTAALILNDRNKRLHVIATVLAEVEDKEYFKQLLLPCAYYLDAAYRMCGLLARMYPEQAETVAHVIKGGMEG